MVIFIKPPPASYLKNVPEAERVARWEQAVINDRECARRSMNRRYKNDPEYRKRQIKTIARMNRARKDNDPNRVFWSFMRIKI